MYNIEMIVKSISETSYSGMFKLVPDSGSAFFIRKEYLSTVNFDTIDSGFEFDEQSTNEILDAGLTCVVELKAVQYLARCEQSRFGLTRKLIEKKFDKKYIELALDFLESKNYLSDERFARAWLHTRQINHLEGRSRLLSELQGRGIGKDVSEAMVNEFFSENDENEICRKAYEKMIKKGKSGEKLVAAMIKAGFSYKMIKNVNEECV